jgi:hypothetical protein
LLCCSDGDVWRSWSKDYVTSGIDMEISFIVAVK